MKNLKQSKLNFSNRSFNNIHNDKDYSQLYVVKEGKYKGQYNW